MNNNAYIVNIVYLKMVNMLCFYVVFFIIIKWEKIRNKIKLKKLIFVLFVNIIFDLIENWKDVFIERGILVCDCRYVKRGFLL